MVYLMMFPNLLASDVTFSQRRADAEQRCTNPSLIQVNPRVTGATMHNQQSVKSIKSYYFLLNLLQLGEEHRVGFWQQPVWKMKEVKLCFCGQGDGEQLQDLRVCNACLTETRGLGQKYLCSLESNKLL